MRHWIGVDLDGTLARWDGWVNHITIGPPVPIMLERVRKWLRQGETVKIVTARVATTNGFTAEQIQDTRAAIGDWCLEHLGQPLEITNAKDNGMVMLWDDRVIGVDRNTGVINSGTQNHEHLNYIAHLNLQRSNRWHTAGIDSWSLSDWAVALAGEVGELCDVVKKLNRVRDGLVGNKVTEEELLAALPKETADVFLYLDLFAQRAGFDLAIAIRQKFNEVSERNGFMERL